MRQSMLKRPPSTPHPCHCEEGDSPTRQSSGNMGSAHNASDWIATPIRARNDKKEVFAKSTPYPKGRKGARNSEDRPLLITCTRARITSSVREDEELPPPRCPWSLSS